jgi:hypothetical protein
MEPISVPDMLRLMFAGPFEITFVTCNRKDDTGGKKITIKEAVMEGGSNSNSERRNPNHGRNYTRNLRSIDSDKIIKFHPLLVTRINGRPVML